MQFSIPITNLLLLDLRRIFLMSKIFSSFDLNGLQISNRIVISPMCQYSAENGEIGEWHKAHYLQMACSGAALFFIEATAVVADGQITPFDLGLYTDGQLAKLADLIELCKSYSSAKIALQLSHAGRKGSCVKPSEGGGALDIVDGGWITYSASAIKRSEGYAPPSMLSIEQMCELKRAFSRSAYRAKIAGIDCLEIHMAHGYLLHQFLSPISNRRDDRYGGSPSRRLAWPIEVMREVRNSWGGDKPLGVRVTARDWLPEGLEIEDAISLISALKKEVGVDYVAVTSGGIIPRTNLVAGVEFQVPFAKAIRDACGIPVIAVGQITEPISANRVIETNSADFIAIARSYLANPHWAWDAAKLLNGTIEVPQQYARGFSF